MSFERPTLDQLVSRAISDLEVRLPGLDARLRRSFEGVLPYALAGLAHGIHGHLLELSKFLPDNAGEALVRRWASILGVTPKDPAYAQGDLVITGVATTSVASGTKWQRSDGRVFATDSTAEIGGGGSVTVAITAVETGEDGNTDGGSAFAIVTPITDVDAEATVDGPGLTGGRDAEAVEDLRARVVYRLQVPPSGGGPGDYVRWALEIPGVTRAWEYPTELGAGTVVVRFAVDGEASPIPSGGKVAEVQAYLEARAPITSEVTAVAPTEATQNLTISVTPNTTAVKAAVETEIEALLLRVEPGGTIYLSQIDEAISLAAGETDHTVTVPAANVTLSTGQLAKLGTITWS